MRPDEYFMALTFKGHDHPEVHRAFHCTVIYFGQMTESEIAQVIGLTDSYFAEGRDWSMREVSFWKEDFFGKEKNVRVIKCDPKNNQMLMQELRGGLSRFQKGDIYDYNPHLTTELTEVTGKFDKLHLFKNRYEAIKTWNLN